MTSEGVCCAPQAGVEADGVALQAWLGAQLLHATPLLTCAAALTIALEAHGV